MSQKYVNLIIRTIKLISMDWETKLIKTYFLVSEYAWIFAEQKSKNHVKSCLSCLNNFQISLSDFL